MVYLLWRLLGDASCWILLYPEAGLSMTPYLWLSLADEPQFLSFLWVYPAGDALLDAISQV